MESTLRDRDQSVLLKATIADAVTRLRNWRSGSAGRAIKIVFMDVGSDRYSATSYGSVINGFADSNETLNRMPPIRLSTSAAHHWADDSSIGGQLVSEQPRAVNCTSA